MNIKLIVGLALLGLTACSGAPDDSAASDDLQALEANCASKGGGDAKVAAGRSGGGNDICAGNGSFDLKVTANDLAAYNGRRVQLAAVENNDDQSGQRRVALVSGTVTNGAFALGCGKSLTNSMSYPSFAAYIDVDGDGRCSNGDLAYQSQRYGWANNVTDKVGEARRWGRVGDPNMKYQLKAPLGSSASDFCDGYFGK
jgi:hypothetical protein